MKKYRVKLFSSTVTVHADYYIIDHGGTLTFRKDGSAFRSFNHRTWSEVSVIVNE